MTKTINLSGKQFNTFPLQGKKIPVTGNYKNGEIKVKRPIKVTLKTTKKYIPHRIDYKQYRRVLFSALIWSVVYILLVFIVRTFIMPANANNERITYSSLIQNSKVKPPFKIYSKLKDECYAQDVEDKKHCIKTGLAINYAESSFKSLDLGLTSKDKTVKSWVTRYKKYWHKAQSGHFFYGDRGEYGKSHYCTSEQSSGSKKGCPNGRRNFDKIFSSIKF